LTLDFRAFLWLGTEGQSRVRSSEKEGFVKGGSGEGTPFHYKDVGADGVSVVPEMEAGLGFGPHRFHLGGFYSRTRGSCTLSGLLEYDGDLNYPGSRIRSDFTTWSVYGGYAYRVKTEGPSIDLGADVVRWQWEGVITRLSGPGTDAESDESIPGYFLPVPAVRIQWPLADGLRLDIEGAAIYGTTWDRRGTGITGNGNGYVRLRAGVAWRQGPVDLEAALGFTLIDAVTREHQDEVDYLNCRLFGGMVGATVRF
jgi:hypothetical protein